MIITTETVFVLTPVLSDDQMEGSGGEVQGDSGRKRRGTRERGALGSAQNLALLIEEIVYEKLRILLVDILDAAAFETAIFPSSCLP